WQAFFVQIGIPATVASRYAEIFRQNRVSKDMLPDLDKSTLADLGVTAVGDQIICLKNQGAVEASIDKPTRVHYKCNTASLCALGTETLSNGSAATGELRKGKLPPDRHEIYHVKMPEGNTARTKQIMQNASMMRKHGLVVRGTTGVRQGGRSVSPVDKRSPAVIRMRQES
ncbi:hypothetical protein Angca_009147, partial [Angiostrongylus cantonensis]